MAEDFERAKERCLGSEEKKKSMQQFIELKNAELQTLQVELVKVEANIKIEENKVSPLNTALEESHATTAQLKSQIQGAEESVAALGAKLKQKSESSTLSIRDSLLRAYAVCTHLRNASKPDPLEQVILSHLSNSHSLNEGLIFFFFSFFFYYP